jgi:methionyl-tRNA formyltransferase
MMQLEIQSNDYVKIIAMNPRIAFMGSPEFARVVLAKISEAYPIIGVVTQPDKPAGRGKVLTPPLVKMLAENLGCEIIQPRRLREPENFEILKKWNPDVIIVAAYGQILRQNILDLPRLGCINVHGSLLPRWRGAAPIQAAILAGDKITGITIMKMDVGVDTGPMLAMRQVNILEAEDAVSLGNRMAETGAELLMETLPSILDGSVQIMPQPENGATYAPMLKKEDGLLDFDQPAVDLSRRVRAFTPWPGTSFIWENQPLKVIKARAVLEAKTIPGEKLFVDGYPAVGCSDGVLFLEEVQPAGKKAMSGKVFLNGARLWGK